MAVGTLAAFWAVSFLLVLVPGADWAYLIAAGLRDRSVLPAVAGTAGRLRGADGGRRGRRGRRDRALAPGADRADGVRRGVPALARGHHGDPPAGTHGRDRPGRTVLGAPGREGSGCQRPEPQGPAAVPGVPAAVPHPRRGLAVRSPDRAAGPGAHRQLRRRLHHRGRHRGTGTAGTACRRHGGDPVLGSRDDRHRCLPARHAPVGGLTVSQRMPAMVVGGRQLWPKRPSSRWGPRRVAWTARAAR